MDHSPTNFDPLPTDLASVSLESRQVLLENTSTIATEPWDRTICGALCGKQLEHAAHPEGQDILHDHTVTVHVDRLQDHLHRHCPVTLLPPEMLAYMFELYVASSEDLMPRGTPSRAPFCLTQVCRLWRAVAQSDPHLWTSIHFHFPESHGHQNRRKEVLWVRPLLDAYLKRSGALPISLIFTDHRMHHFTTNKVISLLVDQLRKHACRWRSISLQLAGAYFPLLFTFTTCSLPSLEHLSISGDTVASARRISTLRLNLEHATNLKSFAYGGAGRSMHDIIDLHWESLSEISLDYAPHFGESYTLFRQIAVLSQCQNITTCCLGIDLPAPMDGPAITLPRLQTLRVRRLSPDAYADDAIDRLILPQLQTLEIDASFLFICDDHWHDHSFSDLLERSRCCLLRLSVQDVDFPNDELVRCLTLSPALTSLHFIPCPRSQDISGIIRRLNVSRTLAGSRTASNRSKQIRRGVPELLAPQLREITLATSIEFYLDSMLAMFRSRVGPGAQAAGVPPLRRAEVNFFDLWHITTAGQTHGPGDRLGRVASFQADLVRWVSENRDENGQEGEEALVTSVIVDSPYLPEYIETQSSVGQEEDSAGEDCEKLV